MAQHSTQHSEVVRTLIEPSIEESTIQENNIRFENATNVTTQQSSGALSTEFVPLNPYPTETPSVILGRVVQVLGANWTGSSTLIANLIPLTSITNNSQAHQNIIGNLAASTPFTGMWRYLRCNFRVTIKLNSTYYHQGSIVAGWIPPGFPQSVLSDPTIACGLNGVIISAAQQDEVTLDIPYMSPRPHFDLQDINTPAACPVFFMSVVNPLLTSNSAISEAIPINVFMQMTEISCYGPIPPGITVTVSKYQKKEQWMKREMSDPRNNSKYEAEPDKPQVVTQDPGPNGPSTGAAVVKAVNKNKQAKEAETKNQVGLTALQKGLGIVGSFLRKIPFVGSVIDIGAAILTNLDKPTSDGSIQYVWSRPNRGHTMVSGADFSEVLAPFPECSVSKKVDLVTSDMPASSYCQIPNLLISYTVTTAGRIGVIANHPMQFPSGGRTLPDYMMFASSFYQFWRGSIKYLIHFVGTPFYSCRFRIVLAHTETPASGTVTDYTGYYVRIIDVKGDAWVKFEVPYLAPRIWGVTTYIAPPNDWNLLIIEAMTNVIGSSAPADAVYYVNVYRAAGSDYQLACPTTSNLSVLNPSLDSDGAIVKRKHYMNRECSLNSTFKERFGGFKENSHGAAESGFMMADTSSSLSDLCKRYVSKGTPSGQESFPNTTVSDATNTAFYGLQFGFAYWRGSRVVKENATPTFILDDLDGTYGQGNAMVMANTDTVMARIPWYGLESWVPTAVTQPNVMSNLAYPPDINGEFAYIAGGDDFIYIYPIPFCFTLTPPSSREHGHTNTRQNTRTLKEVPNSKRDVGTSKLDTLAHSTPRLKIPSDSTHSLVNT